MNKNDLPLALRNAIAAETPQQPPMPEIPSDLMQWLEEHRCPEPHLSPIVDAATTTWALAQRALVREIRVHYDQQE